MNNEITMMDLDLNEFDKETLIRFIIYSHTNNLTFNQALIKMLQDNLPELKKEDENQMPLL